MSDDAATPHAEHCDWDSRWQRWWSERKEKKDWERYVSDQSVSVSRLAHELGTTVNALISRPEQRRCADQLRDYLESHGYLPRYATGKPLDDDAQKLVDAARQTNATTRSQLARQSYRVYAGITQHPQKEDIFAILKMRKGLRHLSNEEIVALCQPFTSLTDLAKRHPRLYKELLGRGLQEQVVSTHGWHTFDYIDVNGQQYRSRMELIFANWLYDNGIRFVYDRIVPGPRREPGKKPWRYDFYLIDYKLYVELLHNVKPGPMPGNTRRRSYIENLRAKIEYYKLSKLHVCWINTEPFAVHNREIAFVEHCMKLLSPWLQRALCIPSLQVLCFNGKSNLSALSAEHILSTLLKDCLGVADYQNHYSSIRHQLKAHPEHAKIDEAIRQRGEVRRTNAHLEHREKYQERYVTYAEAKAVVAQLGLKGQKEFQRWAHHGIPPLPPIPAYIPKDPYSVYKRMGTWVSLADFLGM